jgi:hypothetical protein
MVEIAARIKRLEEEAERIQQKIEVDLWDNPKRGRPKAEQRYLPVPFVVSHSEAGVDELMIAAMRAIGPRKRGNKRWALQAFYTDLTQYFIGLHKQGIALPRNHLAMDACDDRLAQILARHGYLAESELHTNPLADADRRNQIANTLARVFIKVADSIESPPAIMG